MQLARLLFLTLVVCALCVIINGQQPDAKNDDDDDVDRHDVHRIILKREKSKKVKKRTKPPATKLKPFRPNQPYTTEDYLFEPAASTTRYTRQRHRGAAQGYYNGEDYHELAKPKPPRPHDDYPVVSYPEEEVSGGGGYYNSQQQQESAPSSHHHNYVPYLQNSDWNPIPSTQLTQQPHDHFRRPFGGGGGGASDAAAASASSSAATAAPPNAKRSKRKKKPRRKPAGGETSTSSYQHIDITTAYPLRTPSTPTAIKTTTTSTTTLRPLTLHLHDLGGSGAGAFKGFAHQHVQQQAPSAAIITTALRGSSRNPQQHHYVNYNHNNKSIVKYEVSTHVGKPKAIPPAPPAIITSSAIANHHHHHHQLQPQPQHQQQPFNGIYQTIHHNHQPAMGDSKGAFSNSYEVFERAKDYNKAVKQTSFKSTLVPQPIYPKLQPFVPTVGTYSISEKSTKPSATGTTAYLMEMGKQGVGQFASLSKKLFY